MTTRQLRTKNGLLLIDFGDHDPTIDVSAWQAFESALLHSSDRYEVRAHVDQLPGYRILEFTRDLDAGDQIGEAYLARLGPADDSALD
jgi:hypothetical protein